MLKRSRSRSPARRDERQPKSPRRDDGRGPGGGGGGGGGGPRDSFARQQARRNQAHEEAHMRDWVAGEDAFVLAQAARKAKIRVREGRAKPVDQLAVALGILDPAADLLEEDSARPDFEIRDPMELIASLDASDLRDLRGEIESYLTLEGRGKHRRFWKAAKIVSSDRLERLDDASSTAQRGGRGASSVASDIDKVLAPKTLDQLTKLETTVKAKLDSNEPLDEEYWEQLLASIGVYKAKADLRAILQDVVNSLYESIRLEQIAEAERAKKRLTLQFGDKAASSDIKTARVEPEPMLSIPAADKELRVFDETDFLAKIAEDRKRARLRPPIAQQSSSKAQTAAFSRESTSQALTQTTSSNLDQSQATKALYDREAARGVQEDEEVFTGEEEVAINSKPQWTGTHRARKPRYFNRVQMGYEWNKYNQTHYDHDNPPPKVVQGYKFNIFYPELIDKTKAPTYRIERENGRKRGQSFAPAGEEDTCLIRFIAGPPYEELAFRIVDREWDYSAKRERGFKSSFDKGILQLHFHFKKIYYRK